MSKQIEIHCKAAISIELKDLVPLQGGLKELSGRNLEKLKESIKRHGLTFPLLVWKHDDKNFVLDGHQRDKALKSLAAEGWEIPPLPAAIIEAKDRKEAAEKILLISSQYGKMTNHSLQEFLAENDLDFLELSDELELPAIDLDFFRDADFQPVGADEQGRLDQKNPIKCPECGHEWVP